MGKVKEKEAETPKVVEIKPTVLGRKAAEYARLTDANVPADRVEQRIAEDAAIFGISLDDYKGRLAAVKNKSTTGKRAELKAKREKVQALHQNINSRLNEIIMTGSTDLAELQTCLQDMTSLADGWVLMTAVEGSMLTINDRGWNDGSTRQNQYSDRPQPVGKSVKGSNPAPVIHGE